MLFQASRAATGTFLSRVSGLVRDVLIAYSFGATYQYDAYVVAISIPFILRAIFAEGALSSAFIPVYALERHLYGIKFSTIWIEVSKILIATVFASIISLAALLLKNQILSLLLGFTLFVFPFFAILFLFRSENILAMAMLLDSKRKEESKNS